MKYRVKQAQQRLDQIDDQISRLMEEAEDIKANTSDNYDKEQFENLINMYEDSTPLVKDMFLSYVIDTHNNAFGLFL